jgi:hypothetical protein
MIFQICIDNYATHNDTMNGTNGTRQHFNKLND